jgi:hypothetical protein
MRRERKSHLWRRLKPALGRRRSRSGHHPQADALESRLALSSGLTAGGSLTLVPPPAASGSIALVAAARAPAASSAERTPTSPGSAGGLQSDPNSDPSSGGPGEEDGPTPVGPIPAGPAPLRSGATPTNGGDDVIDIGLAGPLVWNDSDERSPAALFVAAADDSAVDDATNYVASGLSTRMETMIDSRNSGWMSYLSVSEWHASSERSASRGAEARTADASRADLSPAASTSAARAPLFIVLNASDVSPEGRSPALEQFAELSPAEESSALALVATLWAVPAESQQTPLGVVAQSRGAHERLDSAMPPSGWRNYLVALDHAMNESYRGVRDLLSETGAQDTALGRPPAARDDEIRWLGPIIPSPEAIPLARAGFAQQGRNAPLGADIHERLASVVPSVSSLVSRADARDGRGLANAVRDENTGARSSAAKDAAPVLSAVTASAVIAGCYWSRRATWPRLRRRTRPSAAR